MGDAALTSINLEISQLRNIETQGFICRVIEPLRSVNSEAYEPNILAIGPYYHGKDKYKMMEEHKLRYLQSILNRKEETAEIYISAMSELKEEARSCYAEPISLNRDNFIKMLVLDGCFIIELVLKFDNPCYRYRNDPIFAVDLINNSLIRDMILFENQIPFVVLLKLFKLIEGPSGDNRLIYLLLKFCENLFPDQECRTPTGNLFPDKEYIIPMNRNPSSVKHLLDLIYSCWTPGSFVGLPVDSKYRLIPSATELDDANVKFESAKREQCNSLFEVKFHNGTLLIPPLTIFDETDCFLRNLLAYEQYFRGDGNNLVATYLKFMDLLINSSKDVDVLTKCGIINNWLGDHKVIASMFNKLVDCVCICPSNHPYGTIFKEINTYRNKRLNRWMAVLNRDYFSSPWVIMSIIAAFVLLILTIIQAVCSILQVV